MTIDIDLEQTVDAVKRFADTSPVARLQPADRPGPSVALWRQTPRLRVFEGHRRRFLAISLQGDSTLEQIVRGRSVWRGAARGTTVLLEPGFECDWRFTGNFEMLQIYLGPEFNLAGDRLADVTTPFRDPVLWHYATTIAMVLREGSTAAPALPSLLESTQAYFQAKYGETSPVPEQTAGLAPATRRRIEDFVRTALGQRIRVEDMAALAGLSVGHFGRAFRESYGLAPYQYVLNQRIARARTLLLEGEMPIAAIAAACGFGGASQFGAVFQRVVGRSPSAFRRAG
ncbi:helix-turn-helix domain-containing protein [Zavarzinia sp.]|uniref:helix-turn-helix domain-containing protein n=1 Tax=Zavarzinia sp. TaxID=2027920 RepID=UPI003BB738E1